MTFSVVYSPSCTVTHSVEGADLLLKCSADANPEVVKSFGKLALKANFFWVTGRALLVIERHTSGGKGWRWERGPTNKLPEIGTQ